jgi:hypothetical protein
MYSCLVVAKTNKFFTYTGKTIQLGKQLLAKGQQVELRRGSVIVGSTEIAIDKAIAKYLSKNLREE